MGEFVAIIVNFYEAIFSKFNVVFLYIGNLGASLSSILFALIVTSFVISIFWRGAKS